MHLLSYQATAILFGIGVTLHNLEEAIWLPGWFRAYGKRLFEPDARIYWVVTSLVSAVIWVPVVGVCLAGDTRRFQIALTGFAMAMAFNAMVPHLVLSIVKRSYMPGAGTGMLLNLPLGAVLIHAYSNAQAGLWRWPLAYALLLGAGAFGALFGAHAVRRGVTYNVL